MAFLVCSEFCGESGLRKAGLGGIHPLTQRYVLRGEDAGVYTKIKLNTGSYMSKVVWIPAPLGIKGDLASWKSLMDRNYPNPTVGNIYLRA